MGKKNVFIGMICFVAGLVFASAFYANIMLFGNGLNLKCEAIQEKDSQNNELQATQMGFEKNDIISKTVPIVAVSSLSGEGTVGRLTVKLIPGNANVLIDTNPFLETDLQYSANIAVTVAKLRSNNYAGNKDFILTYDINGSVIGGESAGAATAIATIAALENKDIKKGIAITGTINHDGSIGRVGGILEKVKAAADAGYKTFLVPEGQTKVRYYERVVEEEPFGFGFSLFNTRYVPRVIDISEEAKKEWGIEVKEVSTIEEAADYMLE